MEPEQDQAVRVGERKYMASAQADQVSRGGVADLQLSSSVPGLQVDGYDSAASASPMNSFPMSLFWLLEIICIPT